jgi:hypothetical protein
MSKFKDRLRVDLSVYQAEAEAEKSFFGQRRTTEENTTANAGAIAAAISANEHSSISGLFLYADCSVVVLYPHQGR